VIARVRAAEQSAEQSATARPAGAGSSSAALVLADRSLVIRRHVARAYPVTRSARLTYSGSGYGDGYEKGKRADIGAGRIRGGRARALTG
jgi:hypothetical protein